MFRLMQSLHFPRLEFLDDVEFSGRSEKKTTALFRLSWSEFDRYQEDQLKKRNHVGFEVKQAVISKFTNLNLYITRFPEKYEKMIHGAVFAIPRNYLSEIRRMTNQATLEWSLERGFDTDIREMCLEPGIAYVKCAFKLINDCLYDPAQKYYSRGAERHIMSSLMLYRFWQHQTGRGLIEERAGFEKLEWLSNYLATCNSKTQRVYEEDMATSKAIIEYLAAMRKYYKDQEVSYMADTNVGTCTGPALGEPVQSSAVIPLEESAKAPKTKKRVICSGCDDPSTTARGCPPGVHCFPVIDD